MKTVKFLAVIACAAFLWTGCASNKCCAKKAAAACGMQCCTDAGTTCAQCPKCSAKK